MKTKMFFLSLTFLVMLQAKAIEQWRVEEINFISSVSYVNPFLDCILTVNFVGPSGEVIARPAFWDGGNTWKVRFAPTRSGTWNYTTSCSDVTNAGLHDRTGIVVCDPYSGNLEIYKHGFIKISNDMRHLAYADETPFLWMSDDHTFINLEKWDTCNRPGCNSQFKYMADFRKTQKFTVYNTALWTVSKWNALGVEPDLSYYQEMDLKFQYLADLGFVISTALGYHKDLGDSIPNTDKVKATKLIARYVDARYGAYPLIYYTCGEFNIPKEAESTLFDRYWWGDIAQAIDDHNVYDHPVSINFWQPQGTWFSSESFFDFWALQAYTLRDYNYYKYWYNYSTPKPIIDAWSGMDHGDSDLTIAGNNQSSSRKIAYLVMQSGGAGWGHLTEGIWNACWDLNDCGCCSASWGGAPWYQTIDYEGANYMKRAYEFYTSIEWWKLVPRYDNALWGTFNDPVRSVISTDDNHVYVVYFYSSDNSTGTLKGMNNDLLYRARWYNPRTGTYTLISDAIVPVSGSWSIPVRPDAQDWLLIVASEKTPIF